MRRSRGLSERTRTDAGEFRPTLERALALKAPAVIEIAVDYRENLPLVQPMRLRAVD
jgi:thiamine pyrophosphate-dependent acetolactate synthase large subunit-like protein